MSTLRTNAIIDTGGGNTTTINGITPAIASQAEAETGTNNTKLMTPLLVKQAATRYAILQDQKANGVSSQVPTANVWTTLDLNTEVYDPDGLVSISANQFTPTKNGRLTWVRQHRDTFQTRMYNVTDAVVVSYGSSISVGGGYTTPSMGFGNFIANKTYRIELNTNNALAAVAASRGGVEVYLELMLEFTS